MRGGGHRRVHRGGDDIGDEREGRKLDRKTVQRALDVARGILRASSEVVGVVAACRAPGGWPVPWYGVD
ncbi:hypothetical protein [Methanocrinis sp.]|uniref:hypothetical protein n=1 Tax=Methanocrinis sp. TaxID=3101522 RepID=UPI003D0D470B